MMAELLPCPFCGGEKLKLDRKSKLVGYNGLDMRIEQHTYSVRCNVCHARGGAVGGKILFGSSIFGKDISPSWTTTDVELKEKAIKAWNTRTADVTEMKHGEWLHTEIGEYYCSQCFALYSHKEKYCPNCGAKMKGIKVK